MGLLEGQIILGRGLVFGPRGRSHSARVIKANTGLLNYSDRDGKPRCHIHTDMSGRTRRLHDLFVNVGCLRTRRRCLSIVLML